MSPRPTHALAAVLTAAGLCLSLLAAPASAAGTRVVLGGVAVALPAGSTQVVTVNHGRSWHAAVVLWERGSSGWRAVARAADGRTGYGGLVVGSKRRQGTGTTPLGTYALPTAFGTHAASSSWRLPYHRTTGDDWWVEDNGSAYYNRMRGKSQGGFRWWLTSGPNTSERLADYPRQYEYVVNTGFNRAQVRYRGAGIFLHVNGRGATAGCISAPRWFMRTALARLDPARKPVIAIGR
ncbi:MAG: secreted protein [Marmoricola sp.]|nr:secreted protein [Marmoricola sp.]